MAATDVRELPSPRQLLDMLGLGDLTDKAVNAMSGGEQQRVALAVTVSSGAGLLLCDEPTSQLGHADRDTMVDLIQRVNTELGTTVVIVTHDPDIAARIPRRITIRNGRIGSEGVHGRDYAVIDQDGAVHLPEEWADDYPAGSLVEFVETEDGVLIRRVDMAPPGDRAR
jgi:ABC-type lipoprotein export system ATPase subunit